MNRSIVWMAAGLLVFALGCGSDEAKDAADRVGTAAQSGANAAQDAAGAAAGAATGAASAARDAAGSMTGNAVTACRTLAEQGAWGEALEVCKAAHEAMPDDLALEHAYQQAQAAAK